jgi:hypothetical protein
MSRNSGILALDIYPDRVMMDPSQMVPGKLYQFELSGEPLIAIKKGSGGIQIYYFPS